MEYSLFKKIQIKKFVFDQKKILIFPKIRTKIRIFFRAQKIRTSDNTVPRCGIPVFSFTRDICEQVFGFYM